MDNFEIYSYTVDVTDKNICLSMEQKIKLYPKSGTKLHVVFEKYFSFSSCYFLSLILWMSLWLCYNLWHWVHPPGHILWKVRSLSPGPINYFPLQRTTNFTINCKCSGLSVTRYITLRHIPKLLIQFTQIKI